ncbi:hypothetical protein, partial [Phocaeicola vulgatus]|uniref:hypothetical protein n=1 Tax=Phocaeicola vulgatus TaxID=821 RepID=UPI0034A3EF97
RHRRRKRSVFHSDFNQDKGLALLFSSANVGRSTSMPNRIAIRMTETGYIAWPVSCPGLAYDATRFILCLPQNREYSPAARKQGKRFND